MWEFDEAVEVRSNVVDGAPVPDQFLWRGRLWRVCSIQARWVETAVWWERGVIGAGVGTPVSAAARPLSAADIHVRPDAWHGAPAGRPAPESRTGSGCSADSSASRFRPAVANCTMTPAGVHAATVHGSESPAAVGVLDADWGPNRTVYRVEAGFGRDSRRDLFDLAHDPDSGRWQLERVMDR